MFKHNLGESDHKGLIVQKKIKDHHERKRCLLRQLVTHPKEMAEEIDDCFLSKISQLKNENEKNKLDDNAIRNLAGYMKKKNNLPSDLKLKR